MSDDSKNTDDLGVPQATENIFHGVHKRAYFHRLAQYGIVPQTEKEAAELLDMGAQIAEASANPALKQAAEQESRFTKASDALNEALVEQGIIAPSQKQAAVMNGGPSLEAQAAAWELAQDPSIFKSAEVLQANREAQAATAG